MLTVTDLVKTFDGTSAKKRRSGGDDRPEQRVLAVDGNSFSLEPGEMFTLLGPSGCGKTTTLRCIAGLERPDGGEISVDGRVFYDSARKVNVPPQDRGLGMVFQSYAIWPHLSVFKNVAFPLEAMSRRTRPARDEIRRRVVEALEATELGAYVDRSATALSGGQQQRLALARALVVRPSLMLLDEPLSNLDAKLRETMRFELKRLQRELGLTSVYVTHDQTEALALSSRIAVMNAGRIEQIGKPREIYEQPRTRFVADFIGTTNFLNGSVLEQRGERYRVDAGVGELWAAATRPLAVGDQVMLSLRPESITLSTEPFAGAAVNQWPGAVVNRAFLGDSVDHVVRVGDRQLRNRSNPSQSIPEGTPVHLCVQPENITIVPAA